MICEISQQAGRAPETRICLSVIGSTCAARLARKMIRDWLGTIHAAAARQKPKSQTEVIMSRLTPIQTNGATAELKRSLRSSHLKLGKAPNFLQIMAHSPASLRAYICADAALVRGQLTPRQREQVALAVAEINGCA